MAFDEILEWSQKQADWTQDGLRRLAQTITTELADEDATEVLRRVKNIKGVISDPALTCKPLSADDLPKDVASTERTLLCSIGPVKNVDRLAKDQTVSFAMDGITLIYGDNGSGKSGYSRITKKLCRSLTVDPLRGNVFEEGVKNPAEALIKYKTDNHVQPAEEPWVDGQTPPVKIANISVFDSKNARLYVDQDNKIQYLPPEIELMERYSSLIQSLSRKVDAEITEVKKRTAIALPAGFTVGSEVSKIIGPLNIVSQQRKGAKQPANTEPLPTETTLKAAAVWDEVLELKLKTLEDSLRDDPAAQAAKCQRASLVLTALLTELKAVDAALADAKGKELESLLKSAQTTKAAAAAAASEIFKSEPLQHTGSDAWKLMYKYAKEYAHVAAGEATEQPAVEGLCVTCQQKISPEAEERLKRFENFIGNKANTEAEAATAALNFAKTNLKNLKISTKSQIDLQLAEFGSLSDEYKAFVATIAKFSETAIKRRDALLTAAENDNFSDIEPTPASVSAAIDAKITALKTEETALKKKAEDNGDRAKEQKRLANLIDQKKMSGMIDTFTARLADLRLLEKLNECNAALGTSAVSTFITKLRKKLVTDDLQGSIAAEIAAFELGHIPFSVKDRSDGGESLVGVKLKAVDDVKNRDVLSEGEQRALALACFLGQVLGDPIKHGIIIDDPVSSLDHIRVRLVAQRLVKEAAQGRQVIIFTHNVLFYSEVLFAAGQQYPQVPVTRHCIRHDLKKGFGIVHQDDEPWIAKDINKRIGLLQNQRLAALKDRTDTDTDEYRREVKDFYTDLREAWERFVEEVLLGGVVERYNSEVKTQSLKRVIVEDGDYHKIFFAMKRVSERSGHDMAAAKNASVPKYDEMKKDLEELDTFRVEVKKRGNKLQTEREKLEEPPKGQIAA